MISAELASPSGSVARVPDGAVVALQADDVDTARRTGWSVTVVGTVRTVREPVEQLVLQSVGELGVWLDSVGAERPAGLAHPPRSRG